jgi:2-oxo-4-hydroxy-4-carboxy--5-ureidoimidazoline (OHCU) decarboxylase
VRELPRQLSVEELAELFSGRTRLVELLAAREHPLAAAREVAASLPEADKLAALAVHPRIGESSPEQHGDDAAVLAELRALNGAYEDKFGFRFVVFVNRRPRSAIVPVLRERLGRTRAEELETALAELVAIAEDRWRRG